MELATMNSPAKAKGRLYYIGPAVVWAVLIYLASGQPANTLPKVTIPYADKVAHGVAYGGLGLLVARAFGRGRPITWRQTAMAFLIGALYGATDELHQLATDGRSAETYDWIADVFGSALGAAAWKFRIGEMLRHR